MTKGLWAGPAATIYNRSIIPQILILSEHLLSVTRWNGKKKNYPSVQRVSLLWIKSKSTFTPRDPSQVPTTAKWYHSKH